MHLAGDAMSPAQTSLPPLERSGGRPAAAALLQGGNLVYGGAGVGLLPLFSGDHGTLLAPEFINDIIGVF